MENSNNNSTQPRILIAMALSMAVLIGWSYLFPPKKPAIDNANAAATQNAATTEPTAAAATPTQNIAPVAAGQPDAATARPPVAEPAPREVTLKSTLYEVRLDSRGAVATSWIILRNKGPKGDFPVYADGSTETEKKPLQLISSRALEQSPREAPFQLTVGDPAVDRVINQSGYELASGQGEAVNLDAASSATVDFVMSGQATWPDGGGAPEPLEVRKSFTFRGDSYINDVKITVLRSGRPVNNVRLMIGPRIGDQAINYHNLYHIEPEAVASINDDIIRRQGYYSFKFDANNQSALADSGTVNWAGVGDAYFAMVAIPATPVQGVEYRASKYEVAINPVYENIYRWAIRSPKTTETRHTVTAMIPVAADGSSVTKIYTGTKDYFLLKEQSDALTKEVGRPIAIVDLINFSNYWWLRWLTKPLSIPILYALNFFGTLLGNYGVAIIVFTFLFYSLLFPLRWSQSKSFKKASGNAPKMKELQDKIKDLQKKGVPVDDPRMRALQMEQLKMTKDALPIGGCLPMLLQFPLLLAFYTAVTVSLEVRQANFLWLPDLSAGDPWHILEFAFAFSMILSMKFTPTAPTVSPEQQMQQRMMTYFMPVMMLWVMWSAPAGLLLYWFFGNVVSFGQQMVINRLNKTNEPPAAEIVDSVPKGAKKVKPKPGTQTA